MYRDQVTRNRVRFHRDPHVVTPNEPS
jgi:hypothetical protein